MKVGYVRVSTAEQNTARQDVLMEKLGVEKIFVDKMSGKDRKRPELDAMMGFVREGDTVIIESISRFARNTKDLLTLVDLLREKNVAFVSQKESMDSETPQGKFVLTMFAAMAELERESILQRQREGIEIAKAEGRYKGRKRLEVDEDRFAELYREWKNGDTAPKYIIKKLGLSRNTFYRRVWEYEDKHGIVNERRVQRGDV